MNCFNFKQSHFILLKIEKLVEGFRSLKTFYFKVISFFQKRFLIENIEKMWSLDFQSKQLGIDGKPSGNNQHPLGIDENPCRLGIGYLLFLSAFRQTIQL